MEEDEEHFNDDIDLLRILEQAEVEYSNTQQQQRQLQQRHQVYANTTNTDQISLYKDTCNEQHATTIDQKRVIDEGSRSNWEPSETLNYFTNDAPTHTSTTGKMDTTFQQSQQLQYKRMQELELETALRNADRLRAELAFKEQELETTKAGLREAKQKLQQASQKDWMDVDQPTKPVTNPTTSTTIMDPGSESESSNMNNQNKRYSSFPSLNNRLFGLKRPRLSTSPSPASTTSVKIEPTSTSPKFTISSQVSQPVATHLSQVETKRRREKNQQSIDRAVNTEVPQITKKDQDMPDDFIRCLNELTVLQVQREEPGRQVHLGIQEIQDRLIQCLRPPQMITETDASLTGLAYDISGCVSRVNETGVKPTLSQLLVILRFYTKLCVQEEKHMLFLRAADLLCVLVMQYSDHIITHLLQEMLGAGDQSTLQYLAKGLVLLPLRNADEGLCESIFLQRLPDMNQMEYHKIKNLLQDYTLGPSDAQMLLTGVTSSQAQETTSNILKLFTHVIFYLCNNGGKKFIEDSQSAKRFLFLLDEKGFMDIITTRKPLATANEALLVIHALLLDGNTSWLYQEKYKPLLKNISALMTSPRPCYQLELEWYDIRSVSMGIYSKIMSVHPTPLSLDNTLNLVLMSAIYILNNECLRIQEGMQPPFESVPIEESKIVLMEAISLMKQVLDVYPVLLDHEEDGVYIQILAALKMASDIIGMTWHSNHDQVHSLLTSLGKILHKKQKQL
ncbi:uncharacterized protein BX664DRAFT_343815 [Halteromyces radiatus]|uniref:uncharacterized protein n=1 Tax=Halteromyces radiatus TaxID=101107 RepID=UPI00221FDADB|nr:uncharacterized protein BX664DRAFT_343815 [Halteromyces radiatus]KAI8076744.1 hypothetical protein BX664DRAFT_343815 [Halteromyces radiatus]